MNTLKLTVANVTSIANDTRPSIACNETFLSTLDRLEDAALDMARYGSATPGTVEADVLQPQADTRWDTARLEFYALLDVLLTEARAEGAAAVLKALQGR
jgi:hypothetical protein